MYSIELWRITIAGPLGVLEQKAYDMMLYNRFIREGGTNGTYVHWGHGYEVINAQGTDLKTARGGYFKRGYSVLIYF